MTSRRFLSFRVFAIILILGIIFLASLPLTSKGCSCNSVEKKHFQDESEDIAVPRDTH